MSKNTNKVALTDFITNDLFLNSVLEKSANKDVNEIYVKYIAESKSLSAQYKMFCTEHGYNTPAPKAADDTFLTFQQFEEMMYVPGETPVKNETPPTPEVAVPQVVDPQNPTPVAAPSAQVVSTPTGMPEPQVCVTPNMLQTPLEPTTPSEPLSLDGGETAAEFDELPEMEMGDDEFMSFESFCAKFDAKAINENHGYEDLDDVARRIANKAIEEISISAEQSTLKQPYQAQYILEEVVKILSAKI